MAQEDPSSFYGYVPTSWVCYTFVVLFGVTTVLHLGEALFFRPRLYWLIPTIFICGAGEIAGWVARLLSSKNPANYTTFMIQLVTTIIAPTFLTAALYTMLGGIIKPLGSQYSRLSSKAYIIIFVTADVLALVVQALGGAIAAGANDNRARSDLGSHIMVGGIFLQMAGITIYALLATEVILRFYFQRPVSRVASPRTSLDTESDRIPEKPLANGGSFIGRGVMPPRVGMMVIGLVVATVLVFIRTIYRTIELLGGWNGRIITTEVYFNVLDATPIVLAMFVLNALHPGYLLQDLTLA